MKKISLTTWILIALVAGGVLAAEGIQARVVSMPSWELFELQERGYREQVLPPAVSARVAVESNRTHGKCREGGHETHDGAGKTAIDGRWAVHGPWFDDPSAYRAAAVRRVSVDVATTNAQCSQGLCHQHGVAGMQRLMNRGGAVGQCCKDQGAIGLGL